MRKRLQRDDTELSKVRNLLMTYLYQSKYKSAAHAGAESANRLRGKVSSWTQSLLGLIVGLLSLNSWNNVDDCGNATSKGMIITSIILSFLAAGIGVTRDVWRFSSKAAGHHETAGNYSDVVSDIELFLTGDMTDLEMLRHFVDVTHERLDIYDAGAATIASSRLEKAKRASRKPPNLFNPLRNGYGARHRGGSCTPEEQRHRLSQVTQYALRNGNGNGNSSGDSDSSGDGNGNGNGHGSGEYSRVSVELSTLDEVKESEDSV